ncbi:MAG: fibrillarin-like rRNA/tRNA 2'-O-methyltransferase [archaeon]
MSDNNIHRIGREYATLSIAPKKKVYDEKIIRRGKDEFRIWDPTKSKLGAALEKGLKNTPFFKGMKILYLGAANGTTPSHISDIVTETGLLYSVEFSPRSMRDLISVSRSRKNIIPILADARMPDTYANRLEQVDLIYCDVAQPDQTEILLRNAEIFLKKGGYIMIAIKARSINVVRNPKEIYAEEREKLKKGFDILEEINLHPLEKDHAFFVAKQR